MNKQEGQDYQAEGKCQQKAPQPWWKRRKVIALAVGVVATLLAALGLTQMDDGTQQQIIEVVSGLMGN